MGRATPLGPWETHDWRPKERPTKWPRANEPPSFGTEQRSSINHVGSVRAFLAVFIRTTLFASSRRQSLGRRRGHLVFGLVARLATGHRENRPLSPVRFDPDNP